MTDMAQGTYENVAMDEVAFGEGKPGAALSRGTVTRQHRGEIEGVSHADVLIARGTPERLGYVATDRFTGRVGGRSGSFVFQHGGTIDRGVLVPFGYVVPGSGTDELRGLTGEVRIAFVPPSTHTLTLTYMVEPQAPVADANEETG